MFTRPDWRDAEAYKGLLDKRLEHFIAWEFLRRNSDYQNDLLKFRSDVALWCCGADQDKVNSKLNEFEASGKFNDAIEDFMRGFPRRYREWMEHFQSVWKLEGPIECDDDGGAEVFAIGAYHFNSDQFAPVSLQYAEVTQARVMIPVDLSDPLEVITERVAFTIRRLRDMGIESGAIVPRKTRILASRLYVEYLRILDGVAAGCSEKEIGELLQPDAANEPNSRQRDKRIRAAHEAGKKMQNGGYRALLSDN